MIFLQRLYPGDVVTWSAVLVLAQIAVVVVLAGLIACCVRKCGAAVRYAVWLSALVSVLLCPLMTFGANLVGMRIVSLPIPGELAAWQEPSTLAANDAIHAEAPPHHPESRTVTGGLPPEAAHKNDEAGFSLLANLPQSNELQTNRSRDVVASQEKVPPREKQSSDALSYSTAAAASDRSFPPHDYIQTAAVVLLLIWIVGVLYLLTRIMRELYWVGVLLRESQNLDEDRFASVKRRLRVKALGRIAVSRRAAIPIVVGLRHPTVLIPDDLLESLDDKELEDVLVHECAHCVRRDLVVGALQRFLGVLFWPHPLMHLLNRRLSRAREEICDNYVVRGSDPRRYARTLLAVAEHITAVGVIPNGISLLPSHLKLEDRVAGLLDKRRNVMTQTNRSLFLSLLAALACAAVLVAGIHVGEAIGGDLLDHQRDSRKGAGEPLLPREFGRDKTHTGSAQPPTQAIVDGLSAQLTRVRLRMDNSVELDFVLQNHSDAAIVLAERSNSWGAYQWEFRVVDAHGKEFVLRNPQMNWYRNAFTTFSIAPSKSNVTRCRLDLSSWKSDEGRTAIFSQTGFPGLHKRQANSWVFPLSITGTFSARKANIGRPENEGSNWAGTIATNTVQVKKATPAAQPREPVGADPKTEAKPVDETWIPLAPLVREDRDLRDAGWNWDGETATFSAGKPRAFVSIPLSIAGSYELQTRFSIVRAKEATAIRLPISGNRGVTLEMRGDAGNSESPTATISLLGLKPAVEPHSDVTIELGEACALTCTVMVAKKTVAIVVRRDGRILFQWAGDASQVAEQKLMRPAAVQLETAYYTVSRFTDLRLRMLSGEATQSAP